MLNALNPSLPSAVKEIASEMLTACDCELEALEKRTADAGKSAEPVREEM